MNISAGTLISEDLTVRLLKRGRRFGPGADLNDLRHQLTELPEMPAADWTDFGRGSQAVRYLMLAALLTAYDSGAPLPRDTGVFGWNGSGCTAENLHFWQDYVQNGRETGRGGLFVATLPTIPFCEAAIMLGCHGPAAYFRTESSTMALFRLLAARPEGKYLLGEVRTDSVCLLLTETGGRNLPDLPDFPALDRLFVHLENRP